MSPDDVPASTWNAATNNDGSNTPPAEMPGITPPKRGRNAIDETREVKLAPPHPLPPAPTPKDVSPPWHTIAALPHRHTATHALPRKSTPSRMAVRTAHRLEASGSRSRMAVSLQNNIPALGSRTIDTLIPMRGHICFRQTTPGSPSACRKHDLCRLKLGNPRLQILYEFVFEDQSDIRISAANLRNYHRLNYSRLSQVSNTTDQRAPKPRGSTIPTLNVTRSEGSYLILTQLESPGLSKVVIDEGQIFINVNDYFTTMYQGQGLDIGSLTRNPRIHANGLWGAYHCYYSNEENKRFAEAFDTLSIIVAEKIYKEEPAYGDGPPKRVLEKTVDRFVQLSVTLRTVGPLLAESSGPKNKNQLSHVSTHVIAFLSKGWQMIHITAGHVEMACKGHDLICFRANQEFNKIERTGADGKTISGVSGSGNNAIHLDVSPVRGDWQLFNWPPQLSVPVVYDGQQIMVQIDYKLLQSRFTQNIVCGKQRCHGVLPLGISARVAAGQPRGSFPLCDCAQEGERLRARRNSGPKPAGAALLAGGESRIQSKAEQVCPFLMMGVCASYRTGQKCGFSHGTVEADDVWCRLRVNKHKVCSNGPKCKYRHEGPNAKAETAVGVVISPDPPALVAPPFPPPPPPNAWAVGFEGGLSERGEQLAAAAVREGLSAAESLTVRDSHADQLMDQELMNGMDD